MSHADPETLALVRLAAAIAVSDAEQLRETIIELEPHLVAEHVEELLLQSHLFVGFPRTLNATAAWRAATGREAPRRDPAAELVNAPEWHERGAESCRAVYDGKYHALRAAVRALHPALDEWMLVDGYGKVLSRPGLPLVTRELCIVAVCAATRQRPQLRSHLHGALNCGATVADLEAVLHAIGAIGAVGPHAAREAEEEFTRLKETSSVHR